MPELIISLLGGCHITWDGKPVTGIQAARLQALFTYLLLHRSAPISRQQLAFQFWPESSEGQARTNLRHLVHSLRTALPQSDTFLLGDGQQIAWNQQAGFSLDVEDFERSLAESGSASALRCALDLYCGDLLPSCYMEDVAAYLVNAIDHPQAQNAIFEIGGPEILGWDQVADMYGDVLGRKVKPLYAPGGIFRVQKALLSPFSEAAAAHSQLFTVRVWSEQNEGGQAAWRFKVQHVLSGEARYFHDWQALVDFIISHYPRLL